MVMELLETFYVGLRTIHFISNRYQRVIIRNCLSEKGNLKGGVPQWSVLGPLLFLLYINDIVDNTQSFSRLFADDTTLL